MPQTDTDSILREISSIKKQWGLTLPALPNEFKETVSKNLELTYELLDSMQKKIENLNIQSSRDLLTDTFNREYCNEFMKNLTPSSEHPVTIIAGDVNNLKLTNDVFGHAAGDYLLTSIADIMKKCNKPGCIIGRFGGDEFNAIMPDTTFEEGETFCERVKNACKNFDGMYLPPSISLGIATSTDSEKSLMQTFAEAEQYMYHNKTVFKSKQNIFTDVIEHLYEKNFLNPDTAEQEIEYINDFGHYLKLSEQTLSNLRLAARIHDIGFIAVPPEILMKRARTHEEIIIITKHCEAGYRLAKLYDESFPVANIILQHHESYDGNGYPNGLKGDEILYSAQILSLISTFTGWCAPQPLGSGITKQAAIDRLEIRLGTQFDSKLLKQFKTFLLKNSQAI